jgi:hypothetical protein
MQFRPGRTARTMTNSLARRVGRTSHEKRRRRMTNQRAEVIAAGYPRRQCRDPSGPTRWAPRARADRSRGSASVSVRRVSISWSQPAIPTRRARFRDFAELRRSINDLSHLEELSQATDDLALGQDPSVKDHVARDGVARSGWELVATRRQVSTVLDPGCGGRLESWRTDLPAGSWVPPVLGRTPRCGPGHRRVPCALVKLRYT